MYKVTVNFEDFNGIQKTKDLLFNLTKTEITKANLKDETLEDKFKALVINKNTADIARVFEDIIGMAYGEKSSDGETFMKSPEIRARFECSAAYDAFFDKILGNVDEAIAFLKGILPQSISKELNGIEDNPEYKKLMEENK